MGRIADTTDTFARLKPRWVLPDDESHSLVNDSRDWDDIHQLAPIHAAGAHGHESPLSERRAHAEFLQLYLMPEASRCLAEMEAALREPSSYREPTWDRWDWRILVRDSLTWVSEFLSEIARTALLHEKRAARKPQIGDYFAIDDPRGVNEFLEKNGERLEGLDSLAKELKQRFGPCEIRMTVLREPEHPEACQLGILISTDLPSNDAWDLLQTFDEEQWIEHPLSDTGLIIIDVE